MTHTSDMGVTNAETGMTNASNKCYMGATDACDECDCTTNATMEQQMLNWVGAICAFGHGMWVTQIQNGSEGSARQGS